MRDDIRDAAAMAWYFTRMALEGAIIFIGAGVVAVIPALIQALVFGTDHIATFVPASVVGAFLGIFWMLFMATALQDDDHTGGVPL